jgi:hypothetical protein
MSVQNGFVPVVPFSSYSEYEEMLEHLITEYESMAVDAVTPGGVAGWCGCWGGISPSCEGHWQEHGHELFMKFSKGMGSDWCDTMNTMVVHTLGTAVRVMIQTRRMSAMEMDGDLEDQEQIRALLKRETRRAIADQYQAPNNIYLFEERNFQKIWRYDDKENPEDYDEIPIAQWQAMQLSFCMINHDSLGRGGAGRVLSCDTIKLILMKVLE